MSFKPETDDIREAPSIRLIRELLGEGAIRSVLRSGSAANMKELFPEDKTRITYCSSSYEAAACANALLICTEWKEFVETRPPEDQGD